MSAASAQKQRGAVQEPNSVNAELVIMTYGAIVTQIIKDFQDLDRVNLELEKMGYNIGVKLVDEFLARSGLQSCGTFRETGNVIGRHAFDMFLGIQAEVSKVSEDGRQFSLLFRNNPLNQFVELPPDCAGLRYCNLLCGVIRGALHMVRLDVECQYAQSELSGDPLDEIQVSLKGLLKDEYQDDEVD